jgi:hypothetical protein
MKLTVRPNDMSIGDLEDFYDQTGMPIEKAFEPKPVLDDDGQKVLDDKGRPVKEVQVNPKMLKVLVWIIERASNPDFTLEDARKVKISELEIDNRDQAELDPT